MPKLPEDDGAVLSEEEERMRKLALLDMAFNIGPNDMFPTDPPRPVKRTCRQCGKERKPYQSCENPECLAPWPT